MSRNVVVTGGGTGIGRAIAARFAAAGDEVVITGRTRERIEAAAAELGHHVRAVVCDHSDVASVEALCRELPDVVHVLVNNAGGNPFFNRPVEGLDEIAAMWSYVFENNLLSSVLTTEALLARLAEGGALVHTGSTAMVGGGTPLGAAKAGLAAWNVGLVDRVAPRRIVTNVLAPGFTPDTSYWGDRPLTAEQIAQMSANAPLGAATPDQIAGVAYFLASPDAQMITGQVVFANGGSYRTR